MNDGSNKLKLNPESVSPDAHQAKKHLSPKSRAADEVIKSLPREICPPVRRNALQRAMHSKVSNATYVEFGHTLNAKRYQVSYMIILAV